MENGLTDKQFDANLIDMYEMLKRIKKIAQTENAAETVKSINNEMNIITLKLKPTIIPENLK